MHTRKSLEFMCITSLSKKGWAPASFISYQDGIVAFCSLSPFVPDSNSSYCTRKRNLRIGVPPLQESLLSETISTSELINLELVINIK